MVEAAGESSEASEVDLALTLFSEERYADAAGHCERALKLDPDNAELSDLFAKASANATAEVDVFVPELRFFDAGTLLEPPVEPRLPSPRNLPGDPHWRRLRYLSEDTLKAWGNPELALMYLAVLLAVLIMGPGRIAFDSMIGKRGRR